jgi:hypothetical protein
MAQGTLVRVTSYRRSSEWKNTITYRIEELAVDKGNEEERRALSDGLSIIRNLKKERLGFRDGND